MHPIQLFVGLGNPGKDYERTRHNAGAWLIEAMAEHFSVALILEKKFHGLFAQIKTPDTTIFLLLPNTYMNHSGRAVKAVADFYKIPTEAILVAHDELDFSVGDLRLKSEGGHGGHNGLRDIIAQLHANHFLRVRIGIDRPMDKDQVQNFVLSAPSKQQKIAIMRSFDDFFQILPRLLIGDVQGAMKTLHTKEA